MRNLNLIKYGLVIGLSCICISVAYGQDHQFVGVKKCGVCHRSKAKGNQLGQWQETPHSKAFETLKSEKSMAKAKEMGIADPTTDKQCAACHITAFGVDIKLLAKTYKAEDGVGCESCHGAGGDYQKLAIMKDREKSIANGLIIPDEKTCTQCHNPDNPFHKEFNFEEYWKKIIHPNPKKES